MNSRLSEPGFLDYILSFDICCLLETFTAENFDFNILCNDFEIFHSPAVRLSRFGRRSGGAVLLVKKALTDQINRVECSHDSMLILRMSNYFATDFFLICAYVPPIDSPYYSSKEIKCNITLIEEELLRLHEDYPQASVLICGDVNARTANWNIHADPDSDGDSDDEGLGSLDCNCPTKAAQRNSRDHSINQFGRILISLCEIYHLCILNGSTNSDINGDVTFYSQQGDSVIDYALLYANKLLFNTDVHVGVSVLSSHMPLEITFGVNNILHHQFIPKCKISKLVWTDQKSDEVKRNLQSAEFRAGIDRADQMLNSDIDGAVHCFTQVLLSVAQCMQCTFKSGARKTRGP